MKRILMFILLLLGLVSGVNAIENDSTLLGHWKFEDLTDSSGNGHTLSSTNLPTSTSSNCHENLCYDFDGTNDFLDTNFNTGDNTITMSVWSDRDISQTGDMINRYSSGGYAILHLNTDMIRFYSGSGQFLDSATTQSNNVMRHYAVTYDGGTLKLYINGVLSTSDSRTYTAKTVDWFIGASGGTGNFFDGTIDEVSLWERTLDSSEVLDLYNNGIDYGVPIKTLEFTNITADNITLVNNTFYNDSINFETFVLNTSTNGNVNHTYSLNGAAAVQYSTNTLTGSVDLNLSEASYNISFSSFNNETSVNSTNYSFIVDRTAPVISVIGNVSQDSYFVNFSTIFDVNYSISGKKSCSLNITYLSANESDSNFFIDCEDTQVFTRAGEYNGFLTAEDNAGNIVTGSVNGTINPLINIFFNDTSNGSLILEYNATIFHPDGSITFPTVQIDGSIQLSPVNDGELDLGNHTIQFQKDSYSKTNFTQLVNTTNAGTNTTFNVTLANIDISIFNRLDESLITQLVNIQLIGPVGITSSTSTGTLNINSTVLVAGDYELITTSTNYFTESIFFTYNNQETIDLDIFMLNKTQANQGQINIFVKNEFEELQPNILVKLLSYNNNSNSFTDVSQTLTDLNGAAIFNIELGTKKYIFRAISGDIIADSSEKGEFVFITGDSRTLILRQGQLQKIPLFKNFIYDVQENETARNNNISNIIVTWDDSDNLVNKVCIQYFKKTGITTIFLQEFCEESSSGILESNVLLNLSQNSIVAEVIAFIDDSTNPLDSFTYLSSNNVEDVLNSLGFLDYIILALVVIAIGIGIWMDIPAVGAGAVIGISWWMVATFPSFVNGTLAALVTLICLGIISAAVRRE